MKTFHQIINGDTRQMNELQDKFVHLIITSLPYRHAVRYATGDSGCIPDGMPDKAGTMRFYRAIFPTGMGYIRNN